MGTKNNPGNFDCYTNAEPDEPMFILLGRDPLAPALVKIWAAMRRGDLGVALNEFNDMAQSDEALNYFLNPDPELAKAAEADACAETMIDYNINRHVNSFTDQSL